jgi:hypothetical protein
MIQGVSRESISVAYGVDTKMGELLDNPSAKAVLTKYLPDLDKAGPMLNMARGMSLKQIAAFPQANIAPDKLKSIVEDLQKL